MSPLGAFSFCWLPGLFPTCREAVGSPFPMQPSGMTPAPLNPEPTHLPPPPSVWFQVLAGFLSPFVIRVRFLLPHFTAPTLLIQSIGHCSLLLCFIQHMCPHVVEGGTAGVVVEHEMCPLRRQGGARGCGDRSGTAEGAGRGQHRQHGACPKLTGLGKGERVPLPGPSTSQWDSSRRGVPGLLLTPPVHLVR